MTEDSKEICDALDQQPTPDLGSPFGSKTVEEMEAENRQMQQIREECSRRPIAYDATGAVIYGNTPPAPKPETVDEQKPILPVIIRGDQVPDKQIEFLWKDRFPYQFGLLAGRQNLGKSMFVAYLTAKITNPSFKSWGDGAVCPTGSVMYFTPEGGVSLTKQRIRNMGGNIENAAFYTGLGSGRLRPDGTIDTDVDPDVRDIKTIMMAIEGTENKTGQKVRLIVIDPITDFMGDVRQNDNAEVAKALRGLDYLAVDRGVCILGVKHVNKSVNATAAVYNVGGSNAFTSKPRFVYMLDKTPESRKADLEKDDSIERSLVVACAKHNDFDCPPSLELTLRGDNDCKRVEITGFYGDWTADSLQYALSEINGGASKGRGRPADDDRNAEIKRLLTSGMSPKEVISTMEQNGQRVGKTLVYEIRDNIKNQTPASFAEFNDFGADDKAGAA